MSTNRLGAEASFTTTKPASVAVGGYLSDQDIEVIDFTQGVILKSPDGTRRRVTTDNAGVLSTPPV